MSTTPPVISRARLYERETLQKLDLACREWGVFYVVDHGMESAQRDGLFTETRSFFQEPRPVKQQVRRTQNNAWGYFDEELTKNTRDWKEIFDVGPSWGSCMPQWPSDRDGFRAACEAQFIWCETLCFELLDAIAGNLGVGGSLLSHAFENSNSSFLRLNYYPTCADTEAPDGVVTPLRGHLGVNHHTDSGALTVLMTDEVPGLEVYLRGAWQPVPQVEGALIINLGDVIQVWSNDRYTAPLHRVRCNDSSERVSVPFFFNPRDNYNYAPLGDPAEARYRPINWGEFRNMRAAGDYTDLGTEVQIEHFRTVSRERC